MDKFQAMSVFVRIADSGSLTAAANALGKSLPAVVRMLAALEESLGVRLLNRTTRKTALTEEGRVYVEHCRKILAQIEDTERLFNNEHVEASGSVSVTAPVRFGEMHVNPAVNRFLRQYPAMQVNLLLLDRVVNLLDEGVDLAVRIAPLSDSTLIAKPIGEIRQVVCASPALLEKHGEPQHPDDLSQLPCVCFTGLTPATVWRFQQGAKKISVKVDGQLTCNQIAALVDACVSGLGFGCFFCYQVMPYVRQGKLKIVLQDFSPPTMPVSLVYQHRTLMSAKVRLLLDYLARDLTTTLAE